MLTDILLTVIILGDVMMTSHYAGYSRYTEPTVLSDILSVIVLSSVMLSIIMLSNVMQIGITQRIVILSARMLSIIMLSVVMFVLTLC